MRHSATDSFKLVRSIALAIVALVLGLSSSKALALCGEGGHTGGSTNAGTKFVLVFMENIDPSSAPSQYEDIYLASLGDVDTVTITCKAFPSFRKSIVLQKGASQSYRISNDIDVLVNGSEFVSQKAVVINSTAPIICYGMNHKQYSADAWLALPVQVAGNEYRVMSYTNSAFSDVGAESSEFAVAAFQDGTNIDIIPADRTMNGVQARSTIHIKLDSGECYQVIADGTLSKGDLTGSSIHADKPIAVFGGHMRAEIPNGYTLPDGTGETSRDHLTEQMPHVGTWGKAWLTTRISELGLPDVVRVLALNDNTTVTVNGSPWRTLAANGYADTMITGPVSIEASGPCLVGQFAHTTQTQLGTGDPYMAIVPPIDQVFNDFTFFISTDPSYTEHHIMIAVDATAQSTVMLDGVAPSVTYSPFTLSGKQYSVGVINVGPGIHRLTTGPDEAKGATLVAYGYGPADSYGYSAGSLLKSISGIVARKTNTANIATAQQVVTMHNIAFSTVYLDSVALLIDGKPTDKVRFKERVWQDVDRINVNQDQILHIDASKLDAPVMCTMRIYSHVYTHDYCRDAYFQPTEIQFEVHPSPLAGVSDNSAGNAPISVYPNPVGREVRVECDQPFTGYVLRNALGEEVKSGNVPTTNGTLELDLKSLPAGSYWVDLMNYGHLVGRAAVHKIK